ncbi:MAG: (2Fe-2S)-binding protein [Eubacteriales bacterium]|nr:(2Fe-2S)-binding protein [Eubacteriales bacterium]
MTEINDAVMDKITKVCLCKSISRATIKKAILEGAHTVQKVNAAVGSGSGPCRGQRCGPKIQGIIEQMKEAGQI